MLLVLLVQLARLVLLAYQDNKVPEVLLDSLDSRGHKEQLVQRVPKARLDFKAVLVILDLQDSKGQLDIQVQLEHLDHQDNWVTKVLRVHQVYKDHKVTLVPPVLLAIQGNKDHRDKLGQLVIQALLELQAELELLVVLVNKVQLDSLEVSALQDLLVQLDPRELGVTQDYLELQARMDQREYREGLELLVQQDRLECLARLGQKGLLVTQALKETPDLEVILDQLEQGVQQVIKVMSV